MERTKLPAKHGMLQQLEGCIEQVAGKAVADEVMVGSEQITEKTDRRKTALWVKDALQRLDVAVDDKTGAKIMQNCGYNCAKKNHKVIERAVARRKKFASIDEFLEAEQQKPSKGTKIERHGNILYQFYTPQAFTRPMRCYCGLLRELPKDETVSITYCNCSQGFVEKYWEAILERPVQVEVLQSAISGAKECKFAIYL